MRNGENLDIFTNILISKLLSPSGTNVGLPSKYCPQELHLNIGTKCIGGFGMYLKTFIK